MIQDNQHCIYGAIRLVNWFGNQGEVKSKGSEFIDQKDNIGVG